jgi:ABC-type oligopeptide transport system substrate-binding subunit
MKHHREATLSRRSLLAAGGAVLAAPLLSSEPLHALARQAGGGPIRWSLTGVSDLSSLDPAKATDQQGFTVVGMLYGGLVKLDEDLLVAPKPGRGVERLRRRSDLHLHPTRRHHLLRRHADHRR